MNARYPRLLRFAEIGLVVSSAVVVLAIALALALTAELRAFARTVEIVPTRQETAVIDRDGQPAFSFYTEKRTNVGLADVSPWVPKAVIASEDKRFRSHSGFDPLAIFRAARINLRAGRVVQGASSITQQLARAVLDERARTFSRKLREIVVALELERRFTKDELLEAYLNTVYFGNGNYGIHAAAQGYFGKDPRDLDVVEAATLAALIPAPSSLSQSREAEALRARRDRVLARMHEDGVLSREALDAGRRTALDARLGNGQREAATATDAGAEGWGGYFKEAVRQELVRFLGPDRVLTGGLRVYTTLDAEAQRAAERTIAESTATLDRRTTGRRQAGAPPVQGALVALDPETGEVRALVGGRNFEASPFDRARQARRQPGSAFKPLVAAAALELGLYPGSLVERLWEPLPTPEGMWLPSDGVGGSQMTIRDALVRSSNRAAVHLAADVGLSSVVHFAHRLGIQSELPRVPSLALGSGEVTLLELTAAYSPFANGGERVAPTLVRRVEDAQGRVIYRAQPARVRVIRPSTAMLMTSMLADAVDRGTGTAIRRAGYRGAAAGKTGTTNDYADAWFVGYTTDLVVGVWIGHDSPQQRLPRGYASTVAVPVWARFIKTVDNNGRRFGPLEGFERVELCRLSGERATEYCSLHSAPTVMLANATAGALEWTESSDDPAGTYWDWFPRGTAPGYCTKHSAPQHDTVPGVVATSSVGGV